VFEGEDEPNNRSIELTHSSKSMLESHVQNIRASLGVDSTTTNDDADMDVDMWSSHLDALGDRLNQEGDRSGFLRMVNRQSRLNASSYSLSSLFSVGSVNCGSTMSGAVSRQSARGSTAGGKRNGGGIAGRALWQGPSSLRALYKLLLEPMEEDLPEGYPCELVLVLEGDLYLVPFSMLRGSVGSLKMAQDRDPPLELKQVHMDILQVGLLPLALEVIYRELSEMMVLAKGHVLQSLHHSFYHQQLIL
jgi:hypothetical protein